MSTSVAAADGAVERPSPTPSPSPSRTAIGVVSKFVKRYYALVDPAKSSGFAQFYQDDSLVTRADVGGESSTGLGVDEGVKVASARAYQSLDSVTLTAVDFQEAADHSIVILIQGALVTLENLSRRFVQSLYLAVVPGSDQETVPRYYVRHDLLRYLDAQAPSPSSAAPAKEVVPSVPVATLAPAPAPKEVTPAPSPAPAAPVAPSPAATEQKPAEAKPVEVAAAPAPVLTPAPTATTSSSSDADNRSKRPPSRQPRGPKREGTPANGTTNGNGRSSPKTDRKEEVAKPAPPATWAQRVAKSADAAATASAAAAPAASASPATVATSAKAADAAPAAAPRATSGAPRADNRSGNSGRRDSPKTGEKGGARRAEQRGGEARADDARTLILKNVPFEVTDPEVVRAFVLKASPEGLGLGSELVTLELKKGSATLVLSSAEHAQRVLRTSQGLKLSLGGREIRVEARNPQRPRQGAPQ